MLTGFAGYSGNRGVGVGREGGGIVGSGDTVGCRLWEIRVKGGFVRLVYAKGGVRGCQLLDDSL